MSLRSPTENENTWERFLASARNDNACHLERRVRSFSNPIFEGGHEEHEVFVGASLKPALTSALRVIRTLRGYVHNSPSTRITEANCSSSRPSPPPDYHDRPACGSKYPCRSIFPSSSSCAAGSRLRKPRRNGHKTRSSRHQLCLPRCRVSHPGN